MSGNFLSYPMASEITVIHDRKDDTGKNTALLSVQKGNKELGRPVYARGLEEKKKKTFFSWDADW